MTQRGWQAQHPPRYAALPRTPSPNFWHSSTKGRSGPVAALKPRALAWVQTACKTPNGDQLLPQQCLYLRPDPQGHGAFRPTFVP